MKERAIMVIGKPIIRRGIKLIGKREIIVERCENGYLVIAKMGTEEKHLPLSFEAMAAVVELYETHFNLDTDTVQLFQNAKLTEFDKLEFASRFSLLTENA